MGFNRRYDPGHSSLKKELQKGKIGRLEKLIITSRDPAPPPLDYLKVSGGIFKDMMIHDFDLARFYLGKDEIDSIFSTGSNISDRKFNKIKDYELASCILKSKKGVQCIITSRDPAPPPLNYLKVSGGIFKDMMIHDFDLARFYLEKDEVDSIFSTGSNISDKKFDKIKDYELASCILRSKKGVQCIITNSRHCSFGYDQRVELFGSKGMLISGNKKENETEIFTKSNTSQKKPLLNFFIDRYVDAYKLQLDELARYTIKKNKPISSFEDGRRALIIANAASSSMKQKKQIKLKFYFNLFFLFQRT